ncbi:MAG: ATP-dependent DNA helicase RecG [Christensenellaceae bacterium]|jgi:ATP-dependent DNA helicase RecG|nr:ATP-dependent DNA helicase RecG [Christensenellaceae bacterium]
MVSTGTKTNLQLKKLGIESEEELLNFLPKNYIDLESITNLKEAISGNYVTLELFINSTTTPVKKGKLQIFRASAKTNDDIHIKLVWFNANYVNKIIKQSKRIRCFGKIRIENDTYELINPAYEVISGSFTTFRGIKPIYPIRGIITQAAFRTIISNVLKTFSAFSIISKDIENKFAIGNLALAYEMVHNPEFMSDVKPARDRIFIEETVRRICAYNSLHSSDNRLINYKSSKEIIDPLIKSLPYKLTSSQERAIEKIIKTMKSKTLLNAMLAGDVGSGKTIVAILVAAFVAKSGRQVAMVAPTEILSIQHVESFNKILSIFDIRCALLIGKMPLKEKKDTLKKLKEGEIDIIIGTHAVFVDNVSFKDLGFVIIDEQHRFGVAQRTRLINKSENADVLTLSATPIPRSLKLAILGNVDLINIERRHDSSNIITAIVPQEKRISMIEYIINECKNGKQAYFIAPRIYDDEGIEGDSAEKLYRELLALTKDEINVALIHGKCSAEEKTKSLEAFYTNKTSILVATSIVEVGIDVPNASIMVIFDADYFGLATLHQLRGRIGRSGQKSYCFLYSRRTEENEIIRLRILVSERDGFKIAERDYETRGAGEWLGEIQSGKSVFNPTISNVNIAKAISEFIDIKAHESLLQSYRKKYMLTRVTLV